MGIAAVGALATAMASGQDYQTTSVSSDNLPVMAPQLKARLTFPMGWSPQVTDLVAWRKAGVTKLRELTLQSPDHTPFDAQVISEVDRGTYVARKVAFNLTADSRVLGLLLVPKGRGPFPAAVTYHDHGARFDIGKEKMVAPWGDPARQTAAKAWAQRYFSGRHPGDELAKRGYVVFATDALGWGDRGTMTYDMQQALAANFFHLGSSLAGLMALEDTRAAAFLASLPEVNPQQVAAVGFSMGAFRAWQAAALSDAITATVAVNWMATTEGLMVPGNNQLRGGSAWTMLHPGMQRFLDYPDVASLAAPKPMLMLAGEQDTLFPLESVHAAFAKMGAVWGAWKAADKLTTKFWPGGHVFEQDQQVFAYDWLDRLWGVQR
jgi:dienelactone hydrolase